MVMVMVILSRMWKKLKAPTHSLLVLWFRWCGVSIAEWKNNRRQNIYSGSVWFITKTLAMRRWRDFDPICDLIDGLREHMIYHVISSYFSSTSSRSTTSILQLNGNNKFRRDNECYTQKPSTTTATTKHLSAVRGGGGGKGGGCK